MNKHGLLMAAACKILIWQQLPISHKDHKDVTVVSRDVMLFRFKDTKEDSRRQQKYWNKQETQT